MSFKITLDRNVSGSRGKIRWEIDGEYGQKEIPQLQMWVNQGLTGTWWSDPQNHPACGAEIKHHVSQCKTMK